MREIGLRPSGADASVAVLLDRPADSGGGGEAHRFQIGDRKGELAVEWGEAGAGWLRLDGRVVPCHVSRRGSQVWVWLDGRSYVLEVVDGAARRTTDASDQRRRRSDRVTAPMPGRVRKIAARAGESFEAHQPLVIMESMKMELTLSVPHAGRVKEITCHEGQLVEMGALLVLLETDKECRIENVE